MKAATDIAEDAFEQARAFATVAIEEAKRFLASEDGR